jgi:hemoglobin-like flavoprotein
MRCLNDPLTEMLREAEPAESNLSQWLTEEHYAPDMHSMIFIRNITTKEAAKEFIRMWNKAMSSIADNFAKISVLK